MTRWFELAAFTPTFRDHSAKDTPRAEPWVDGPDALQIRRHFVEERYRLLPYIFALADLNARTGDPLMRPTFYDYPDISKASCDQSMAFTLGRALLVASPPKMESPEVYDVCLPRGGWYDYWTGSLISAPQDRDGFTHVSEKPRLDSMPVFVRAGTILPRQPLVQSTSEIPDGPLSLDVYPGNGCAGIIYFDDGHSMAFQKGHYLRQALSCAIVGKELVIKFAAREGDYKPWWTRVEINVHGASLLDRISSPSLTLERKHSVAPGLPVFDILDPALGGVVAIELFGVSTNGTDLRL